VPPTQSEVLQGLVCRVKGDLLPRRRCPPVLEFGARARGLGSGGLGSEVMARGLGSWGWVLGFGLNTKGLGSGGWG